MDKHSPTPWRVGKPNYNGRSIIWDAIGSVVTTDTREADARLIVEAVNAIDATLKLQRTLLGWSMERDRLRDLVRRLADSLDVAVNVLKASVVFYPGPPQNPPHDHLNGVDITALLDEARKALGEHEP